MTTQAQKKQVVVIGRFHHVIAHINRSLLVWSKAKQTFYHIDSIATGNRKIATKKAQKLRCCLTNNKNVEMVELAGAKQPNSYDCGVYVLANARYLFNSATSVRLISYLLVLCSSFLGSNFASAQYRNNPKDRC